MNKYYNWNVICHILPKLRKINNKYPNIDWGGCGIFAYNLSLLLNNLNVKHQIVYTPEENIPPNSHRCHIKFYHIYVKINNSVIDNFGIRHINIINKPLITLNPKTLKEMLNDKKLWNDTFPHKLWIPLTQDMLNIKLNKNENSYKKRNPLKILYT